MQLLLIRHALPLRSAAGEGSDPELSEAGLEQARRLPEALKRWHLPSGVDENAFRARVAAAVADVVAAAGHGATVAVVSHGGVINLVLHEILGTARLLSFPVDYASVTRLLYSRSGRATVVAVNGTDHVWDLLPRNRR